MIITALKNKRNIIDLIERLLTRYPKLDDLAGWCEYTDKPMINIGVYGNNEKIDAIGELIGRDNWTWKEEGEQWWNWEKVIDGVTVRLSNVRERETVTRVVLKTDWPIMLTDGMEVC
jgi:hypothetical protein